MDNIENERFALSRGDGVGELASFALRGVLGCKACKARPGLCAPLELVTVLEGHGGFECVCFCHQNQRGL